MQTESSIPMWESASRYSINWKAFGLISVVMMGLMVSFLVMLSLWNDARFTDKRNAVHSQYQVQLERFIEASADKMIQLSSAASLNRQLMEAIKRQDAASYLGELEALDWNLQSDAGTSILGLFNQNGENLYTPGLDGHAEQVRQVVALERPHWQVSCEAQCQIVTYTALLYQGEMNGVLALVEPLSNVMLRFQHVANLNTGLLGRSSEQEGVYIPAWERSLLALTNPEQSRPVLSQASKDYSLEQLSSGVGLIQLNDALYELKAIALESSQVVVISDVSSDYTSRSVAEDQALRASVFALFVGELALLIFLWHPLRQIKMSEGLEKLVRQQAVLLKEHAQALSQAESLSESLSDSVDIAILSLDQDGQIVQSNQTFRELIARPRETYIGQPVSRWIQSDQVGLDGRIQNVLDGVIDEYEHVAVIESQNGQRHRMLWRYVPCYEQVREGQAALDSKRSLLVLGKPLSLPTEEGQQKWLLERESTTGLLNRRGFDMAVQKEMEGDVSIAHALTLIRLPSSVLTFSANDHKYLDQIWARFAADFDDTVIVARTDVNECAVFMKVPESDPWQWVSQSETQFGVSVQSIVKQVCAKAVEPEIASYLYEGEETYSYQLLQRAQIQLARNAKA